MDIKVTHMLSDNTAVFGFDQCVIIGLSGSGFSQFNEQFIKKFRNDMINIFTAIIRVKFDNGKWILLKY